MYSVEKEIEHPKRVKHNSNYYKSDSILQISSLVKPLYPSPKVSTAIISSQYYKSLSIYRSILVSHSKRRLLNKYKTDNIYYPKKKINHIIFNEKYRIVAIFKDFLITDDNCEFLKR